jgi:putative nucleotidyltransferase with HDIG domain
MKCPGQDTQYWQADAIYEVACPRCGRPVEFFKDDTSRRCGSCGHRFVNPKLDFGCAAYCPFAEQCLGDLPPELLAQRQDLLKDRVAAAVKRHLGRDFKRIGHVSRMAGHAEHIARGEGADLAVVLAAAYLHDIGRSHDRQQNRPKADVPQRHEVGGPARDILTGLGAPEALIEEVLALIALLHHNQGEPPLNLAVLHDAHRLAELEQLQKETSVSAADLKQAVAETFLTDSGRQQAAAALLGGEA